MKTKFIYLTCLLLSLTFLPANAQRRKVRKQKEVVQKEDPKFEAMLDATARIVIFDSVVVDSSNYLDVIYPNQEEGRISTYYQFFKDAGDGIVYLNQMGNKCIYSKYDEDLGRKLLFQSDLLADGWTVGEPLKGIDDGSLTDFDHPYLMPDGVTLYFSACGGDGLGGYDIYRTRFDIEEGKYLRPENLGLPFNSKDDDYMFVIDEQNQLAYFASNRRQPQGKTCVYSFIPFETRTIAKGTPEKIRSLAHIEKISDTWGNGRERRAALSRKQVIEQRASANMVNSNMDTFSFVINDNTTYTKLSDFRKAANRSRMKQLLRLKNDLRTLQFTLDKARDYYATASSRERNQLKGDVLETEQQRERVKAQIRQIEKTIRITENQ
jgi:hypothetical protein